MAAKSFGPQCDPLRRAVLAGLSCLVLTGRVSADESEAPRILPADEAAAGVAEGELILIDLRTPEEWRQSGIPRGAHALAMQDPDFWEKYRAIRAEAPDLPVALICATGGRSGRMATALVARGETGIRHVAEGMMGSQAGPGWLRRGLPLERP